MPSSPLRRFLVPVAILALAVGGFYALKSTGPKGEPAKRQEKVWPVTAMAIQLGSHRPVLRLIGRVETPHLARLTAAVSAEVKELHYLEGDVVAAGAVLMVLDDSDYVLLVRQRKSELAEVEAQIASENQRYRTDQEAIRYERSLLELSERAVERALNLEKKSLGSSSQADEARMARQQQALAITQRQFAIREHDARLGRLEAQKDRAGALLSRALLDLDRTRISAPFRGRIARTRVAPADRVRAGDALADVYDLESLEIRAQIPDRWLPTVRATLASGEPLPARIRLGDQTLDASLNRLSGEVESGGGGQDGLFRITAGGERLPMGQTLSVELSLPAVDTTAVVPAEALYGIDRVYRIVDGHLERLKVTRHGKTRDDGDERVVISASGLRQGDQVVTTQLPNAMPGLKVSVVE